jgi:hypothetical protein
MTEEEYASFDKFECGARMFNPQTMAHWAFCPFFA